MKHLFNARNNSMLFQTEKVIGYIVARSFTTSFVTHATNPRSTKPKRKSPFSNPDTKKLQDAINMQKQTEYVDVQSMKRPKSQSSEQNFFDSLDIPPTFDTLGSIVSPYVKPEKKSFMLTPQGVQQRWEAFKNSIISTYSIGLIKRYVKPFPIRQFAVAAEAMYINTNKAVTEFDKHALRDLATANVSYALRKSFNSPSRIVTWDYLRTIERPRIVHARVAPLQSKDNFFAQVTVRVHTEHVFSVKNRYGRLLDGGDEPRTAVEHVVLERHIVNPYGKWRICGKLFADEQQKQDLPAITGTSSVPAAS